MYALVSTITIYFLYKTSQILSKKDPFIFLFVLFAPLAYSVGGGRTRSFGFLLLAALYLLFNKFVYKNSKLIWLVPLIFLAWVNLHGSFILGIFTLATLSILTAATKKDFANFKTLAKINILSFTATLINPYFANAWKQAFLISQNYYASLQFLNLDWFSLAARDSGGWIFALIAFALVLLISLIRNKINLSQRLLLVIFLSLSVLTARFVFALFIFFLIPANQFILEFKEKLNKEVIRSYFFPFLSFALILILLLMSFLNLQEVKFAYSSLENYSQYLKTKFPKKYSYMNWPYQASLFVSQNLNNRRLLNEANWGSLLLLQDPHIKVFYYGAMDNFIVNGQPFVLDYLTLVNTQKKWQEKLDYYKIDAIFLPNSFPLVKALKANTNWKMVYEDNLATILLKD